MTSTGGRRGAAAFPLLCALGYAGAVVGYLPLLTLLLPAEAERLAGPARFGVLAAALTAGAVAAAAANILFGWLSDRARARRRDGRRRWIAGGLAATLASFALLAEARTPAVLVGAVILFQVALNAVLAPLLALIAEEVPDERKGSVGGLLAAAPALASLLTLALASAPRGFGSALAVVGVVAAALLAPLILTPARASVPIERGDTPAGSRRDLAAAWVARLLVQTAGNVLFADLLYLMEEAAGSRSSAAVVAGVGWLLLLANVAPLPLSVWLGRWSDRSGRRAPLLVAIAVAAAAGLALMGAADGWTARATGFALFAIGAGVFLPLQTGFIMRLLPSAEHRGRDLGVMNLTNTLPALIGQGLAWWLAAPGGSAPLLYALALATAAGGAAMLLVGRVTPPRGSRSRSAAPPPGRATVTRQPG